MFAQPRSLSRGGWVRPLVVYVRFRPHQQHTFFCVFGGHNHECLSSAADTGSFDHDCGLRICGWLGLSACCYSWLIVRYAVPNCTGQRHFLRRHFSQQHANHVSVFAHAMSEPGHFDRCNCPAGAGLHQPVSVTISGSTTTANILTYQGIVWF